MYPQLPPESNDVIFCYRASCIAGSVGLKFTHCVVLGHLTHNSALSAKLTPIPPANIDALMRQCIHYYIAWSPFFTRNLAITSTSQTRLPHSRALNESPVVLASRYMTLGMISTYGLFDIRSPVTHG
ncbi:hypothetical protein ABKN59_010274 [Abortiporus biennis]